MESDLVSLVIPGKNCERTLRSCLDAVVPLLKDGPSRLAEIIFVDDGSTDTTPRIASDYPVRIVKGPGGGPGAARNLGWKAAENGLIWFIDSDCVARPDALSILLPYFNDEQVGGAGGSYDNMRPDSLLACLIHEEIIARHSAMTMHVNFLGSFNVVYRRSVLAALNGFDEHRFNGPGSPGAEDAELAYRIHEAGHRLCFNIRSKVCHFHPTNFRRYLRAQRHHGYWRVNLHWAHPHTAGGDAYSSFVDHSQPLLAMISLGLLPSIFVPGYRWLVGVPLALLLAAQLPMTLRLVRQTGQFRQVLFAPMSFFRAFARGLGMTYAVLVRLVRMGRGKD